MRQRTQAIKCIGSAYGRTRHLLRATGLGKPIPEIARNRRAFAAIGPPPYAASSRAPARYLPTFLLPSTPRLIRRLRMAEGLNTMTQRGEIGTSLPVFGLRPMRWPFLRTTNEPNNDSLTVSPRSRQSVISLSTISTSVADAVRDSPTF